MNVFLYKTNSFKTWILWLVIRLVLVAVLVAAIFLVLDFVGVLPPIGSHAVE
jgi:hypothetical protein